MKKLMRMLKLKRNRNSKKFKENLKMKLDHCKNQKNIHLKNKRNMKNLLKVWKLSLESLPISYSVNSMEAVRKV